MTKYSRALIYPKKYYSLQHFIRMLYFNVKNMEITFKNPLMGDINLWYIQGQQLMTSKLYLALPLQNVQVNEIYILTTFIVLLSL